MSYIALATTTLGSTSSSVTFSSIPATYKDLILVVAGTINQSNNYVSLQFNSDTASNYSNVFMTGYGSNTTESIAGTNDSVLRVLMGTSQSVSTWQLLDYSATDKHKTVLSRSGANSSTNVNAAAARWANTNAINTIRVFPQGASFNSGTTLSLYGVA